MTTIKQALVIGNGAYSPGLELKSPADDARRMKKALAELGFNVTSGWDTTFDVAQGLVDEFLTLVNAPSTTISLLYYSGHGLQIEGLNYMVPVDFDHFSDERLVKLISVQSIVDQMTRDTTVRIVLLDACRSNADAQMFVRSKGVETGKGLINKGDHVAAPGLAEIEAATNTFVAFAAAPGQLAYEGAVEGALSPFTASLLKHLDAVDLPISNLTSRVRQDVLESTEKRQRTWDSSSLLAPFYFNPGSLLVFMGNLMALVGLVLSMIPFSFTLAWPRASLGHIAIATSLPIFSLAILLFGMQSVYSRLRGNYRFDSGRAPTVRDHLFTSIQKGVLGGYLGSFVAAIFISVIYYRSWDKPFEPFGKVLLEITVATALTSCILSACSLFFARISIGANGLALSPDRSPLRLIVGAAAGGILAGLIAGPSLTVHFGLIADRPEMRPWLLLPGAIVGASILIFSIVNFDFDRLTSRRVWTSLGGAVAALGAGVATSGVVFGLLAAAGVVGGVIRWMEDNSEDATILALGGAIYGLPVGFVLGVTIGLAIVLTERWSGKPALT